MRGSENLFTNGVTIYGLLPQTFRFLPQCRRNTHAVNVPVYGLCRRPLYSQVFDTIYGRFMDHQVGSKIEIISQLCPNPVPPCPAIQISIRATIPADYAPGNNGSITEVYRKAGGREWLARVPGGRGVACARPWYRVIAGTVQQK